jgi:hypothetical protein
MAFAEDLLRRVLLLLNKESKNPVDLASVLL